MQCCPASNGGQGGHLHETTRASIPTAKKIHSDQAAIASVGLMCLKSIGHKVPTLRLTAQSRG